jgi:hypothetical protein
MNGIRSASLEIVSLRLVDIPLGAAEQLSSRSCMLSQSGQSDRGIMTEEVLVATYITGE